MIKNITISCYVAAIVAAFFIALAPPVSAYTPLREDTAAVITLTQPFVDCDDGVTPEIALTPTNITCNLIKGITRTGLTLSASGGNNDFVLVTDDTTGMWTVELTASNTDTPGPLTLSFSDPDVMCPVTEKFWVYDEMVYDSLYAQAGTDVLDVNVTTVAGTAQTANDNGADINAILEDTGTTLPSTLSTIAGYIDTEVAAILEDTGTTLPATLTTIAGYIDTEVASILEDTGTTLDTKINAIDDYVDTEVAAILVDTGTTLDTAISTIDGIVDAILVDTGTTLDDLVDDLESRLTADRAGYLDYLNGLATDAEIADAVWDEAKSGHTDDGTFGGDALDADTWTDTKAGYLTGDAYAIVNNGTYGNSALESLVDDIGAAGAGLTAVPYNAAWDAEIQSEATDALNAYDAPTATEMTSAFTQIKGATWDTTDTLEAIRDRGDSAWVTATGFSTHSAADVVNEWETQSQADPTGFHVNLMEIGGTAQTANDNGADINAILADTETIDTANELRTLLFGSTNALEVSASGQVDVYQIENSDATTYIEGRTLAAASYFDPSADAVANVTAVGTLTTYTGNTPQTGDAYAIVNNGTYGNSALENLVDDIGTAGAGLTAVPWNASWDAEVQSESADALVAIDLDHLMNSALPTGPGTDIALNSALGYMMDAGTAWSYDRSTDSLEALESSGGGATAQEVWEYATGTGRTLSGTVNDFDELLTGLDDAADVADAVWDEAATGHTDAGKAGEQLWTDVDAILVDTSTTLDDYLDTEIASILEDTGTTLPGTLSTIAGYIDTEVAAILEDTGTTLDTKMNTIDDFLDTEIAAILADTGAYDTDAEYATAIWGALTASYNTADTFGLLVGDQATVSEIAAEIWATDKDSPEADSYGWVMNTLLDVLAGRMKIDTSAYTMTWYDYDSDTTPSQVFYLFDSAGAYSTTNVYERDKDALP